MLTRIPYDTLGHADHGWLDARHHFSFASYHDPRRTGFGALRVVNDDTIAPGRGFAAHPHRDMEIITYVRQGAITHRDSLGNHGRTAAGDVQVMSAGTGVTHSEHNAEDVPTRLYQIWITPRRAGVAPRWDTAAFPKETSRGELPLLVSGRAEDEGKGALYIHQDAALYGGRLAAGTRISQPVRGQAYLLLAEGSIEAGGQVMRQGDGAEARGVDTITILSREDAEILLIDLPPSGG